MAYLAVNNNGTEVLFQYEPHRCSINKLWYNPLSAPIYLPTGTIEKILGYRLTWLSDPVHI